MVSKADKLNTLREQLEATQERAAAALKLYQISEDSGNPSSLYGKNLRKEVYEAREIKDQIAELEDQDGPAGGTTQG
ncbi:MAG: hypothetical protein JKP92_01600 [Alphaproteobacteria bacterium]|jgi:hypothetical protein|nr:hypothetical protein [Alphaproteobacteria bacterium]